MKKILLMGNANTGKTSIKSIIFPTSTVQNLGHQQQQKLIILGYLTLHIWDCGGSSSFMDNFTEGNLQNILKNTQLLIYAFDISQPENTIPKSLQQFKKFLSKVQVFNQNSSVFVLIHKIDKISPEKRQEAFDKKKEQINSVISVSQPNNIKGFFATSIWNQSLYQAWCSIMQYLIPNKKQLNLILEQICDNSGCQQAVLFQRSTFLVLSHFHTNNTDNMLKYEQIAHLLKHFRLTCKKYAQKIEQVSIQTNKFNVLITRFTKTDCIMLLYRDRSYKTAIKMNVTNMGKQLQVSKNKLL